MISKVSAVVVEKFKHAKMRLLPLDYVVGVVTVCALLFFLLFAFRSVEGQPFVYIVSESGEQIYPLSETALTFTLSGPVGETEVAIQNRSVRVLRSPGREQICVNKGEISQHGEWLICLPNHIFIRIAATESDNTLDSHSY